MRALASIFALPWHYFIFAGIVCMGLTILSSMHQQDPNDNFRDRNAVIVLGAVAAVVGWITLITGAVKFVIWWRQG